MFSITGSDDHGGCRVGLQYVALYVLWVVGDEFVVYCMMRLVHNMNAARAVVVDNLSSVSMLVATFSSKNAFVQSHIPSLVYFRILNLFIWSNGRWQNSPRLASARPFGLIFSAVHISA